LLPACVTQKGHETNAEKALGLEGGIVVSPPDPGEA